MLNLELVRNLIEVDLNRTKVSRLHDELITKLVKKLRRIADNIKTIDSLVVKAQYEQEVKKEIQIAVEDAYFAGQEYADVKRGRVPISVNDIITIQRITDELHMSFWSRALRVEIKEYSLDLLFTAIARMVSDAMTKAINDGTLSYTSPAFPIGPLEPSVIMATFTTRRDEKVCPICEALDGNVYELDDFNKPEIPEDTHPNCRCRYLISKDGQEIG